MTTTEPTTTTDEVSISGWLDAVRTWADRQDYESRLPASKVEDEAMELNDAGDEILTAVTERRDLLQQMLDEVEAEVNELDEIVTTVTELRDDCLLALAESAGGYPDLDRDEKADARDEAIQMVERASEIVADLEPRDLDQPGRLYEIAGEWLV